MARVIVAATPATEHFASMWVIAKDLVARGHRVSFVTGETFRSRVEEIGASFCPMDVPDFHEMAASEDRLSRPSSFPRRQWDLVHLVINCIQRQYEAIQAAIEDAQGEPVVLLSDHCVLATTAVGFGAPGRRVAKIITVGTAPFTLSSVDVAPFGMGLPPDSTTQGRERNRVANAYVQQEALAEEQKAYVRALRSLGVRQDLPFFLDAPVLAADRFLQLSLEELSYKRSDLPAQVSFVGALPVLGCGPRQLPSWWPDVEAADRVVVVTQGTVAHHDLTQLVVPALEALADEPVLVVASTGRDAEPITVPDNARVAPVLPFDALLPRAEVFVTNGEFGTTEQALRLGTLMVLAGQSEDKLETNVRVAMTGCAVNLATDRPTPDQLRTAIETVTTQPLFRKNAERLASAYSALHPLDTIADAVDRALNDLP